MIYVKQMTDYNCTPSCIQMLLDDINIKLNFNQKEISYFIDTEKDGTYYHKCVPFLKLLGLKLKIISKRKAMNMLKNNEKVLISYNTGIDESHSSILVGVDKAKDIYYLYDPWYGKNIKIPIFILNNNITDFRTLTYID